MNEFDEMLKEAIKDIRKIPKKMVPREAIRLNAVRDCLMDIVGEGEHIEISFEPDFYGGAVSAVLDDLCIGTDELMKNFRKIIALSDAFEVVPLTNGKIEVAFTINGLYEDR